MKRADKAALLRNALAARRARASNPCRSKRLLGAYRGLLPAIQNERQRDPAPTGGSPRGQVEADALGAHAALLALPRARRCGGVRKANVGETKVRLLQSDKRRLRMRISFPTPTFSAHQVGSSDYQQMFMEGMGETGEEGRPGLPILTNFLAVPQGARLALRVEQSAGYTLKGVNLFPHQPEPVDGAPPDLPDKSLFRNEPFVKSSRAYRSRSPFPSKLSHAKLLGNMRELRMGGVDVVGGQYRPRLRNLRVLTSIDVTVRFRGGEGNVRRRPSRELALGGLLAAQLRGQRPELGRGEGLPRPRRPRADLLRRGPARGDHSRAAAGREHVRERASGRRLRDEGRPGGSRPRPDRHHARGDPGLHPRRAERRLPAASHLRGPVRRHLARAHLARAVQ